ncbi:MAG: hypothetical protein E7388_07425 [Ruminococcaceae bacterium]|nr:hypothetical protein [Oscillospiraceae bacterium]
MKAFKMIIICVLAVFMFAFFCGCRMDDGKIENSPSKAPTATRAPGTEQPKATAPSTQMPNATDGNGNLGEDIGQGVQDIGEDIKNASGAAKQVNS